MDENNDIITVEPPKQKFWRKKNIIIIAVICVISAIIAIAMSRDEQSADVNSMIRQINDPDISSIKTDRIPYTGDNYMGFYGNLRLMRYDSGSGNNTSPGTFLIDVGKMTDDDKLETQIKGLINSDYSGVTWTNISDYKLLDSGEIDQTNDFDADPLSDQPLFHRNTSFTTQVQLPANLYPGLTWNSNSYPSPQWTALLPQNNNSNQPTKYTLTVLGTATVNTPSGSYPDSLIIEKNSDGEVEIDAYAQNLGLIKTDAIHNGETMRLFTLRSIDQGIPLSQMPIQID